MASKPYDYARKKVFYCWSDEPVRDVARRLVRENVGSMVVKDKSGKHVGMLTDSLIFESISAGLEMCDTRVRELDLEPLVTAPMSIDINEALQKFKKTRASRLALVNKKGVIVGILKEKNLKRFALL